MIEQFSKSFPHLEILDFLILPIFDIIQSYWNHFATCEFGRKFPDRGSCNLLVPNIDSRETILIWVNSLLDAHELNLFLNSNKF